MTGLSFKTMCIDEVVEAEQRYRKEWLLSHEYLRQNYPLSYDLALQKCQDKLNELEQKKTEVRL